LPAERPRSILALVHGIGGHGGLFEDLAGQLLRHGHELHALDLPGHGLSPGQRGWIPAWEAFRESVRRLLAQLSGRDSRCGQPFLLGHSLGGTIALDLALREPTLMAGVIVSNPAVGGARVAAWRLLAARGLSRLRPRFSLPTGIPLAASARDPEALARFAADPLRHGHCTARLATEYLATAAAIRRDIGALSLPLLVLQSGADPVTPADEARRVFEAAGTADKDWRLYPRSLHELFDDLDRQEVISDLAAWLERHGA
jgi:alpha-beta hydrolase superfamily lysophospholipase